MAHKSELIEKDIEGYLQQHQHKSLITCLTCGSVDDGKSTLIGRLLHDAQLVFDDQLATLQKDSKQLGTTGGDTDFALLVDGLQSEREQGITIDVAYRYFSTDKAKFILADTPGHEQYTRNMVTGASNCQLAIILIDARKGVLTQTRRHSHICALLGIKHLIVAVNKMDMVDYGQPTFDEICREYRDFAASLALDAIHFVPISAFKGENVVHQSAQMPWYQGLPLMALLESQHFESALQHKPFRFQVQYVNRPSSDFRGYAGTVASGCINVGDEVLALPSKRPTKIAEILTFDGAMDEAVALEAVTLTLTDEIDLSRGDMLVKVSELPQSGRYVLADVVWMHESPLQLGTEYLIKHGTKRIAGRVFAIDHVLDINTNEQHQAEQLQLNDVATVRFELNEALHFDGYDDNPQTGAFIAIDRISNATVAAAMLKGCCAPPQQRASQFSEFELELNALIRKHFPHWQAKDISQWRDE